MQFQSDERIAAEKAATEFYDVLERIGVILDDIHIDEPCKRCASEERRIKVCLGNLHVDDVKGYAEIIEDLIKRSGA
ncbi:hypothetical protein [Streptomyces sp. NPDC056669]|uniref:hypothetical protein n=1 Tax=Streptomyces sp. NPDC056669 TaxID=3345903 RepID=UPI0036D08C85